MRGGDGVNDYHLKCVEFWEWFSTNYPEEAGKYLQESRDTEVTA